MFPKVGDTIPPNLGTWIDTGVASTLCVIEDDFLFAYFKVNFLNFQLQSYMRLHN